METEYVVMVRFDSKDEAEKLVSHLEKMASAGEIRGSFGSAEAYNPYHYIADVLEVAVLKFKAMR